MPTRFAANVEMQFTSLPRLEDRIRAAAAAGFDAVEFWRWEDANVPALRAAARDTGVEVALFATDWSITVADPDQLARFVTATRGALATAAALGTQRVVATLGNAPGAMHAEQVHDNLAVALRAVAPYADDAGVTLLIEPLNTRVDHPGSAIHTTPAARRLLADVDHPSVRLLFDAYHSAAQGEDAAAELLASAEVLDYLQIADHPGRLQPGAGGIDWPLIARAATTVGYHGIIGLECGLRGSDSHALAQARSIWEAAVDSLA